MPKRKIEQYEHKDKKRVNNPPVGMVTPTTDPDMQEKKTYEHDPHIDPQLNWTGKKENLSFDIDTVSLHVHERIDPNAIIETVKKETDDGNQLPLFSETKPLREAIEFYKHRQAWSNRLIAGDSLLVMNSLLEKEGMAEKIQMVYIDPPYGISYGSNFQPFVNNRNVKDRKDSDLTNEPEMIKAFRDTWELGIHSYLTYMRDRLKLSKDLLKDTGSIFVQISDENMHLIRSLLDEIFGVKNFCRIISVKKTSGFGSNLPSVTNDYLLWYAKDFKKVKYNELYLNKDGSKSKYNKTDQFGNCYYTDNLTGQNNNVQSCLFEYNFRGRNYTTASTRQWKTTKQGIKRLEEANRLYGTDGSSLCYKRYFDDFPYIPITDTWLDTASGGFVGEKIYVVQTQPKIVQRCILMTTDPGDLVFDPTCGSGTTAFVAEKWGRRWITCDTSRVSITVAKQRLLTSVYDYYKINDNVDTNNPKNGFLYKKIPHISIKSFSKNDKIDLIAEEFNPKIEASLNKLNKSSGLCFEYWEVPQLPDDKWDSLTIKEHKNFLSLIKEKQDQINNSILDYSDSTVIYNNPLIDKNKIRLTGPFTVEAVPAPVTKNIDENKIENNNFDNSISRVGETLNQSEWKDELLKTGIRIKGGNLIEFSRVESMSGTKYIQAVGETKEDNPKKVFIVFGPKHAPLEQRIVELAWTEARSFKPDILLFCAFQFDEEAAKDIDELTPDITGMQLLKIQMNTDMLTEDLRTKKSSNESFWLIGQPDIKIHKCNDEKIKVEVLGFDYYNPKTGNVESGSKNNIAMWMLDTDYNERSLFPNQVFFPLSGNTSGWNNLKRNLKAEIDLDKIDAYNGTSSLEFKPGKEIAVKIIDDRGIESLRVFKL